MAATKKETKRTWNRRWEAALNRCWRRGHRNQRLYACVYRALGYRIGKPRRRRRR